MQCFWLEGIEGRFVDNAVTLVTTVEDLTKVFLSVNDKCYGDQQLLDEFGGVIYELGEFLAFAVGFDHKWAKIGATEHMGPKAFQQASNDFLSENWFTSSEYMRMDFPETYKLANKVKGEVDFAAFQV